MKAVISAPLRGNAWIGGANYFRSLVQALRAYPPNDGSTAILLSNRTEYFDEPASGCVRVVHAPWLDATARVDFLVNDAANSLVPYNPYLCGYAKRVGADLVTHATPSRWAPCPILFWLPDFQHRHLPGHFSAYERWRRDRHVRAAGRHGHILFSSRSAVVDFRQFFPDQNQTQAHVLPFLPTDHKIPVLPKAELLARYAIAGDYFFLPNQFWKHKNHQVVVDALERLPERFQVVCTGALTDYRGVRHIRALVESVERNRLHARFRMLGILPRQEVLSLMHHALCVINPSLSEGWSTVVEEAKVMGKFLILSDIPVHREQGPPGAVFFHANDADALAAAMEKVPDDRAAEQERRRRAHAAYEPAVANVAERYWRIVRTVAGISSDREASAAAL